MSLKEFQYYYSLLTLSKRNKVIYQIKDCLSLKRINRPYHTFIFKDLQLITKVQLLQLKVNQLVLKLKREVATL